MKVQLAAIRAAGPKQTIITWLFPNGYEMPVLYNMPVADAVKAKECQAAGAEMSLPMEALANLTPPK